MAELTIRGQSVDVDIRDELEQFEWTRATWSAEKLLAASPFRYDNTPSFYVYLEDTGSAYAGNWGDSGHYDAEYAKGGFVKLLAFLREETEEETEDHLLAMYAATYDYGDIPTLKIPQLKPPTQRARQALNERVLAQYSRTLTDYLLRRGVNAEVQRTAGVVDTGGAVGLPWRFADGSLANVKYRAKRGKTFWYEKNAVPIRELIYGIDRVYETNPSVAVLTEAEIDALSADVAGYCGIATGGAAFSQSKRDVLIRSPAEELAIMTDADKAGAKLREEIIESLRGYKRLSVVALPTGCKDANDVLMRHGAEGIRKAVAERTAVSTIRCMPYFYR